MAWVAIAAARYAAGKLWLPALTYDMMARDYNAFTVPLSWNPGTQSKGSLSTSYVSWFSATFFFPDNWSQDLELSESSTVEVHLWADFTASGGITDTANVRVGGGDATEEHTIVGSQGWVELTQSWATWPTGEETITFEAKKPDANGATDVQLDRDRTRGADCYLLVVL